MGSESAEQKKRNCGTGGWTPAVLTSGPRGVATPLERSSFLK
jgi:hypothetical protein